jgi:hypothetical protein
LVGVAVKVMEEPAQIVVLDATTATAGIKTGFTVRLMELDVAGEPIKHGVALEVISTVTEAPFVRVVDVNVEAVCPATGFPFTNH